MTRELKDSENDRVGRTTVWRLKYIKQQTDGNRKDKGTIPNTLGKIFHQFYDYCKCNEYGYHASKMHVSESELRDRIVQVRHWQENADFSKLFWILDRNGCLFPQYIIQVITRV